MYLNINQLTFAIEQYTINLLRKTQILPVGLSQMVGTSKYNKGFLNIH